MNIETIPAAMLAILFIAGTLFLIVHWRFHPKETQLDSIERLEKRLVGGKPTLIQFHAPL